MVDVKKYLVPRMTPGAWVILGLFLGFALGDFYSTFKAGAFLEYVEVNPLFPYIGIWGILVLNFVVLYLLLMAYSKGRPFIKYFVLTYIAWLSVIRVFVIRNNLQVVEQIKSGAVTLEAVQAIPQAVKTQQYIIDVGIGLLFPLVVSVLVYALLRIDHRIVSKWEK